MMLFPRIRPGQAGRLLSDDSGMLKWCVYSSPLCALVQFHQEGKMIQKGRRVSSSVTFRR